MSPHHKASQYFHIIKHHNISTSQSIIIFPSHKESQYLYITKHHNVSTSQNITIYPRHKYSQYLHVTKNHNISKSQSITMSPHHKASQYFHIIKHHNISNISTSQSIAIFPRHKISQYIHVTKHHNISMSQSITISSHRHKASQRYLWKCSSLYDFNAISRRWGKERGISRFRAVVSPARFLLTYNAGHAIYIPPPVIHRRELICRVKWKAEEEG